MGDTSRSGPKEKNKPLSLKTKSRESSSERQSLARSVHFSEHRDCDDSISATAFEEISHPAVKLDQALTNLLKKKVHALVDKERLSLALKTESDTWRSKS